MKAGYLVCYDITKPRRLGRVFRYLKGKGIHLQYSVFYCMLTWPELLDMKYELSLRILEKEDDVRIYPLPAEPLVRVLGCGARLPEGIAFFID
jgi:CRISPR-associated protein Cas2